MPASGQPPSPAEAQADPLEARIALAWARFDQANGEDPTLLPTPEGPAPREQLHARWLTEWVLRLQPSPSVPLRLAARCQHLCRWKIPRAAHPADRAGYLRWRAELKRFHADLSAGILRECGFAEELIDQVRALNLKANFPADPDSRVLEDALCLLFLERQFADLAAKTDRAKVVNALRKSWAKMTPAARSLALELPLPASARELLEEALGS